VRIGYIRGAGDEIPPALKNMGYEVWEMKDEEVTADNIKKLDAVVLGVRALNTNERIRHYMRTSSNTSGMEYDDCAIQYPGL